MDRDADLVRQHYDTGQEADRLDSAVGTVEFERTKEILLRVLPQPPATIADVGGGPGRYSTWLAASGYEVILTDVVPRHVEEAYEAAARAGVRIKAGVGDARSLGMGDETADAVLLLGPLYHLTKRSDRLQALMEARRVVRPGGIVFVAAISRWAARQHGMLVLRVYETHPEVIDLVASVERSGVLPPLFPGDFPGYCHRPAQLRAEVRAAGLTVIDLAGVEGIAFALPDLEDRMKTRQSRDVVLDSARAIERVPELLGLSPHMLLTAMRPKE
jgi:SAM-dependent methyltransferase